MKLKLITKSPFSWCEGEYIAESDILDEESPEEKALQRAWLQVPEEVRGEIQDYGLVDGAPTYSDILSDMRDKEYEETSWPARRRALIAKGYTPEQADRLRQRPSYACLLELV